MEITFVHCLVFLSHGKGIHSSENARLLATILLFIY